MQISMIRTFLELCESGSLSKSAEKLHISQQGLSKQLKSMEQELQVRLFDRTSKGLVLTRAGEILRPYYETILSAYRESCKVLEKERPKVTIRLGFAYSATDIIGLSFVRKFELENPAINFDITSLPNDACEEQLLHGEVDCIVCCFPKEAAQYDLCLVGESRCVGAMNTGHRLAGVEQLSHEDLAGETIYVPDRTYRMRQIMESYYPNLIGTFYRMFVTSEPREYMKLPRVGPGIALGFEYQCKDLGEGLTFKPFRENVYAKFYYCTRKGAAQSPALAAFTAYIHDTLQLPSDCHLPLYSDL